MKRWMFAGVAAVLFAAVSLSTVEVAAQPAKAATKKAAKPGKLDLSKVAVLKAGAGEQGAAAAAAIGAGKAIDGAPKSDRPNLRPELAEAERAALREHLARLLGVEASAVPTFKLTSHLNAPGDTLVLALNTPPGNGVYINAFHARHVYRTNNGPGYVQLVGDDAAGGGQPSVSFHTGVQAESLYLYTCFVTTDLPQVKVSLWEYGASASGDFFTLPVQSGKLFVPYETGAGAYGLTLYLYLDGDAAGKSLELSHCELTRVR